MKEYKLTVNGNGFCRGIFYFNDAATAEREKRKWEVKGWWVKLEEC